MLGGPRPLPSQPVRPNQPGQQARPGMPGQPPGARPPFGQRPPGQQYHRPGQRPGGSQGRRERPSAPSMPSAPAAPPPISRTITLAEGMTVKDLADKLDVRVKDVLAKLLMKRMMMTINSTLDMEVAKDIAREFGAQIEMRSFEEELVSAEGEEHRPEDVQVRAPVVTVMGHVDHGKTSLLDAIRETKVAEREAGGITQHIGAYHVDVGDGRSVVFLDTPGHEAFTLMRARGAKVTDVVVLVVAADDGVMPQTREAVDHAKAANVPIVVAINKIDKAGANPDNVKRELAELNLVPEDWGGSTVMVPVSAKKRQNLDQLLEMILLSTDILELKANPKRSASGTVLEAKLDRGRGPVATVLVQDGTLNVGDNFIAGPVVGKVRALIDDRGRQTRSAGPATPVEVLGLTSLPQPGDPFQTVADAAKARQIATFRQTQAKERALGAKGGRLTLESLREQIAEGGVKELPLIVKADVQGSSEVLADTLTKLSDEKVKIRIIRAGVGAINESDVLLASASNAIIIGFNVRPDRNAQDTAEREEVDIRHHTVIYNVTEEIQKAMAGLLDPTFKEVRLGSAEVREVFKVPKIGAIAGCMVTEGRITRSGDAQARLLRDNVVVWEGRLASLRRFKDDVSEVKSGFECGIGLSGYNDIRVGDRIEVSQMERVTVTA
jgi:translation initiation factor IF-2